MPVDINRKFPITEINAGYFEHFGVSIDCGVSHAVPPLQTGEKRREQVRPRKPQRKRIHRLNAL